MFILGGRKYLKEMQGLRLDRNFTMVQKYCIQSLGNWWNKKNNLKQCTKDTHYQIFNKDIIVLKLTEGETQVYGHEHCTRIKRSKDDKSI